MPDRVALMRITVGEEDGRRRYIQPGKTFSISDGQAKELDQMNPPVCYDPRHTNPANPEAEEAGAEALRRIAESTDPQVPIGQALRAPEGRDTRDPGAIGGDIDARRRAQSARGNGNTTRQPPDENDDL